ncbi:MAG: D-arabinono-1,4-lactone oxidase [Acidobacteriota bacterium]
MKYRGYLYVALATTLNVILNGITLGKYLWLEGRVRGGIFRNWGRRFRYKPTNFAQPTTEAEIVELVRKSKGIRFFGSAHSFNDGVVADHTLVSLDKYSGVVVRKDLKPKQMCFKGGTRIRDVVKFLLDKQLAFKALPSHDAQSIAGILSTDVHGTGRNWGFVSESVVSLRIIDGRGDIHECGSTEDLFKAAIGGVGAVGIISEVVVQGVDRFNVEQRFELAELSFVEANFERLLRENEHFSLYLFPFTTKCQISIWNRTEKKQSFLGPIREFIAISVDALMAVWFGALISYTGLLPRLSSIAHSLKRGTNLVMESNKAYNRSIYHLHQELEFTVPFEETFAMCKRFVNLYEKMYTKALPYTLLEVRFTPAGHDLTLIGAGRERLCTWIDLVCNDSHGFENYYDAAEESMKKLSARPHLGKFCQSFRKSDMVRLHGQSFAKFLQVVDQYDPDQKFANEFTRRLFRD